MIHPDDDIARVIAGRAHGERLAVRVQHDQRARRVETNAVHGIRGKRSLGHRTADARGAGVPDVRGRLLDNVAGLLPDLDRSLGGRQQLPSLVEDPCPRAQGSDVDADKSPHASGPMLTFAHPRGGPFANVSIKGPLAKYDWLMELEDLTFA